LRPSGASCGHTVVGLALVVTDVHLFVEHEISSVRGRAFLLLKKKLKKSKKKLATIRALHLDEMLADKRPVQAVQKKLKKKLVRP
jgi:hypothetical protein